MHIEKKAFVFEIGHLKPLRSLYIKEDEHSVGILKIKRFFELVI